MKKWEYQVSEDIALIGMMGGLKRDAQEHLDKMSAEGWELVSTEASNTTAARSCIYFWKRPLEDA